jgi:hypothetical protein
MSPDLDRSVRPNVLEEYPCPKPWPDTYW